MLEAFSRRLNNRLLRGFPGPIINVETDRPIVSFTFDDVPDTALSAGAGILEAHDARGTFYISAGLLDRREQDRRLIDADGCAELLSRGHELGCHTFSHLNLQHTSRQKLITDLDRNAQAFEAIAPGFIPRNFAFPYNAGALRHRGELTRRFRSMRGGANGINRGPTDRSYLLSYPLQQPAQHLAQMRQIVDKVASRPGWLIFFGHDLSPQPTPYGCTPEQFKALVDHTSASGCTILTIDQALERFEPRAEPRP